MRVREIGQKVRYFQRIAGSQSLTLLYPVPPDIIDQLLRLSTSFASLVLLDQCSYPLILFQRMVLELGRSSFHKTPLSLFIACKALETWMSIQPFSDPIRVKQVMECAGWVVGTFLSPSSPENGVWRWSDLTEHASVASLIRKSTALMKLGTENEAFVSSFGRPRRYILDSSWSDFSFKGVDIEDWGWEMSWGRSGTSAWIMKASQ